MNLLNVVIFMVVQYFHGENSYPKSPINMFLFSLKILFMPQNELERDCVAYPVLNHSLFFKEVFELNGSNPPMLLEDLPSLPVEFDQCLPVFVYLLLLALSQERFGVLHKAIDMVFLFHVLL